jgi:ATP-binding cassette subfamily B protein/subfamily B ATP-binding cassette protein MsbA
MSRWWLRLMPYAWPYRAEFGALAMVVIVAAGMEALRPWPLKLILDYVLTGKNLPASASLLLGLPGTESRAGLLAWLTAFMVLIFLGAWLLKMAQSYLQARTGAKVTYALAGRIFDHLQHLSLRFHATRHAGDLVQRVASDTGCARGLVTNVLLPLSSSVISLIVMFGFMWRLDHTLSLLALLVSPLLLLVIRATSGPMERCSFDQAELQGEMMGAAEQVLSSVALVQACGREAIEDMRFRDLAHRTGRAYIRSILSQYRFTVGTTMVVAAGTAAVMITGGLDAAGGSITIGSLVLFLSYLASLYQPLENIAYVASGLASAAGGAQRVLSLFDVHERVEQHPEARRIEGDDPFAISIDNVRFEYQPGSVALERLSLEIVAGETIAVVGPSGSGKSTLAALLCRLYDPTAGSIRFNGIDLRELDLASLRQRVALVLQETFLLPVSVAENISYGFAGATRDQIVAAAKAACADEFIERLPDGYDTVLGERGCTLSGGQRQRLSVARAILRNPSLLICDEPTAALDPATEAELMASIEALSKGRTTILIAHRLSTVRHADRILVLHRGELVEAGTDRELLAAGGLFSRLWGLAYQGGHS